MERLRAEAAEARTNGKISGIIDTVMDEITPCLRDSRTGKLVETAYSKATAEDLDAVGKTGWRFDWAKQGEASGSIYKLTLAGDTDIQGLISF